MLHTFGVFQYHNNPCIDMDSADTVAAVSTWGRYQGWISFSLWYDVYWSRYFAVWFDCRHTWDLICLYSLSDTFPQGFRCENSYKEILSPLGSRRSGTKVYRCVWYLGTVGASWSQWLPLSVQLFWNRPCMLFALVILGLRCWELMVCKLFHISRLDQDEGALVPWAANASIWVVKYQRVMGVRFESLQWYARDP